RKPGDYYRTGFPKPRLPNSSGSDVLCRNCLDFLVSKSFIVITKVAIAKLFEKHMIWKQDADLGFRERHISGVDFGHFYETPTFRPLAGISNQYAVDCG